MQRKQGLGYCPDVRLSKCHGSSSTRVNTQTVFPKLHTFLQVISLVPFSRLNKNRGVSQEEKKKKKKKMSTQSILIRKQGSSRNIMFLLPLI